MPSQLSILSDQPRRVIQVVASIPKTRTFPNLADHLYSLPGTFSSEYKREHLYLFRVVQNVQVLTLVKEIM